MRNNIARPRRGLFIGLTILSLGVILLLDQEGFVSAEKIFHFFWPAIFIFFGLENILFTPPTEGRRTWGWVLLALGVLMLGSRLGIPFLHIQNIWPLLLILAGGFLIARAFGHLPFEESLRAHLLWRIGPRRAGEEANDAQFDYLAIFGGVNQRIFSKNFRGGSLFAICGGWDLDLRRAEIEGDTAVIDASAFMGGGQIRVPDTWLIDMRGTAILGGYTDETAQEAPPPGTTQKRLVLQGVAIFGGVVVKN